MKRSRRFCHILFGKVTDKNLVSCFSDSRCMSVCLSVSVCPAVMCLYFVYLSTFVVNKRQYEHKQRTCLCDTVDIFISHSRGSSACVSPCPSLFVCNHSMWTKYPQKLLTDFDEICCRGGAWPWDKSDFGGNPDSFVDTRSFTWFFTVSTHMHIFVWIVGPQCSVNCFNCAV